MSARPHFACCCLLRLLTGRDPGIESTLSHTPLPPRKIHTTAHNRTSKWVKITTHRGKGNGSLVFWGLDFFLEHSYMSYQNQTTIPSSIIGENNTVGNTLQSKRPPRLTSTFLRLQSPPPLLALVFLLQFHFLPIYREWGGGKSAIVDLRVCDEFRNGADGSTTETRIE